MTEPRYIRNIAGQVYDVENDKFYHEDYEGKPLEYEDEVIKLLNEQDGKIKELTTDINQYQILVESLKDKNQKLKLKIKRFRSGILLKRG